MKFLAIWDFGGGGGLGAFGYNSYNSSKEVELNIGVFFRGGASRRSGGRLSCATH